MSQGSHISQRYYKSRIPKGSHSLGCNHIRTNPTSARARKDSQGQRRTCRDERRESGASYSPGNAHRGARRRVSTALVTKRWQIDSAARLFRLARITEHARRPPRSKGLTSPPCNGQHSGCRRGRPVLPCMLPLRQPSLLLLLGWPQVLLVKFIQGFEKTVLFVPKS